MRLSGALNLRSAWVLPVSCCALALAGRSARAGLLFDPVPITVQASSQFDTTGTYSPTMLFDGPITPADLGTSNHLGGQYASSGTGNGVFADNDFNPVVSTAYSSLVSANAIVYAQRTGGGGFGADKVDAIYLWFTAAPFSATLGAGNPANNPTPAGAPDEIITITDRSDSLLHEYAFPDGRTLTAAYVTMEFIGDSGRNPGTNPGGYEFRLAQDSAAPEPASLGVLAAGATLLLLKPSKRKCGGHPPAPHLAGGASCGGF